MAQPILIAICFFMAIALCLVGWQRGRRRVALVSIDAKPAEFMPISPARTWIASAEELHAIYSRTNERRLKDRRGGAPTAIRLLESGQTKPQEAYVLDRSDRGLRIAVRHPISAKRAVRIRADHAPEGTAWVELAVCWCGEVKGGYDIGCKFKDSVPVNVRLMFG